MIAIIEGTALPGVITIITRTRRSPELSSYQAGKEKGSLAAPFFLFYCVVSEAR